MRNQSVRLYLYSSLAIVALTLFWGVRSISKQGDLGEKAVRSSVEQEMVLLTSAVRASTQAMKYRLLDVLKAEGGDRQTRTFQQSSFVAATLLEWDSSSWKMLWHSNKSKSDFRAEDLKMWLKEWPLAQIGPDQTYFVKVGDLQGVSYFAVIVPVRKPNNVPMFGVGVFPASQFGLSLSAERTREVRVFDNKGFAIALSHPAYLGTSLKRVAVVEEALSDDEVNTRIEQKNEAGQETLALATRMTDSNLYVSIESPVAVPGSFVLQSWIFLILGAAGAIALNFVLFQNLYKPLMSELEHAEAAGEQLRKLLAEKPEGIRTPVSSSLDFIENARGEDGPLPLIGTEPATAVAASAPIVTTLGKVVQSSLRSLDQKIREYDIKVQTTGLELVEIEGDILQLQTALEEVLKNSIESMQFSEFKWLSMDAVMKDGRVTVKISDSGSGIAKENLDKVFDPFFSTKDSEGVARGLGLNVVRRVIEELHGTVDLESHQTATENGTTVTMIWPHVPKTKKGTATAVTGEADEEPTLNADADFLNDGDDEDMEFTVISAEQMKRNDTMIRKPKVRTLS